MLIIWSIRLRRTRKGHVAALCPVRRVVDAFEWWECRRAFHLYFIPIERGKVVHGELRAEQGRLVFQTAADAFPYVELRPAEISFEELIARTDPGVRGAQALAVDADQIAAAAPPGSSCRLRAMLQRFEALEYVYRLRAASGPSESVSAIVAVIAILAMATAAVAFHQSLSWWIWPCAISAFFLPAAVYRAIVSTRRSGWQPIEPYIVESLAPLAPTADELETVRRLLHRHGYDIAAGLRPDALATKAWAVLDEQRVPPPGS